MIKIRCDVNEKFVLSGGEFFVQIYLHFEFFSFLFF
jgi:hypothetical protein